MWVGLSGHAEHQRGVGDENFLGVDAIAAGVGEGDVERGGRRVWFISGARWVPVRRAGRALP
jgi:hypothetical protein